MIVYDLNFIGMDHCTICFLGRHVKTDGDTRISEFLNLDILL